MADKDMQLRELREILAELSPEQRKIFMSHGCALLIGDYQGAEEIRKAALPHYRSAIKSVHNA